MNLAMFGALLITLAKAESLPDFQISGIEIRYSPRPRQTIRLEPNRAHVWDEKTRQIHVLEHSGLLFAGLSPDASTVVTLGDDGASLWDAHSGLCRMRLPRDPKLYYQGSAFYYAAFSPDGLRLAAVSPTACNVWDVKTGRLISGFLTPRFGYGYSVVFGEDGKVELKNDEK